MRNLPIAALLVLCELSTARAVMDVYIHGGKRNERRHCAVTRACPERDWTRSGETAQAQPLFKVSKVLPH